MRTITVLRVRTKYGTRIFSGTRKECIEFLKKEKKDFVFRNYQMFEVREEDLQKTIRRMDPPHERTF